MIVHQGRIAIFDCIEFNDELRWVDVLSEVAFVVMDLEDRGHSQFARRFLNRYLEQTGDYPGLVILRLYLVYRALVRAKVACIRGEQPGLSETEKAASRGELESYLKLAEQLTHAAATALILTHGFSGSGKSVGSEVVVEALGAIRIRSDVE